MGTSTASAFCLTRRSKNPCPSPASSCKLTSSTFPGALLLHSIKQDYPVFTGNALFFCFTKQIYLSYTYLLLTAILGNCVQFKKPSIFRQKYKKLIFQKKKKKKKKKKS